MELEGLEAFVLSVQYTDANGEPYKKEGSDTPYALIIVATDDKVADNFSTNFQLRLPDGSIHDNWLIPTLAEKYAGLEKRVGDESIEGEGGFFVNDKKITRKGPRSVPNQPNGLSIPYSMALLVPYEEMSYERETVTKRSALKLIDPVIKVNDLTSDILKDYIHRMSSTIKKDFNRIDVWVPDNQKAKFEQLLQNTGYDIPVNYVPQDWSNSNYEFQLVKTEKKTVKIEEK